MLAWGIVLERPFPSFQRAGSMVSPPSPFVQLFFEPLRASSALRR